jgi:hypothetical protein
MNYFEKKRSLSVSFLAVVALVFVWLAGSQVSGSVVTPQLLQTMASTPLDQMIPVIVTLREKGRSLRPEVFNERRLKKPSQAAYDTGT